MTKFEKVDKKYKDKRKLFSAKNFKNDIWPIVDSWPLYAGLSNLSRNLAIIDLIRSTLNVPGDLAEFGSWNGSNLLLISKILKLYNPYCNKVVHSFDSFEGLTTFDEKDGIAKKSDGSYAGNLEILNEIIELYDLKDDIKLHIGLIQDTLPKYLSENPNASFSFIYADTDLYEPTSIICSNLVDYLMPGGLIVFDQWNDPRWPGEGIAANEFLRKYSDVFEVISVQTARQPNLVLKKLSM